MLSNKLNLTQWPLYALATCTVMIKLVFWIQMFDARRSIEFPTMALSKPYTIVFVKMRQTIFSSISSDATRGFATLGSIPFLCSTTWIEIVYSQRPYMNRDNIMPWTDQKGRLWQTTIRIYIIQMNSVEMRGWEMVWRVLCRGIGIIQ